MKLHLEWLVLIRFPKNAPVINSSPQVLAATCGHVASATLVRIEGFHGQSSILSINKQLDDSIFRGWTCWKRNEQFRPTSFLRHYQHPHSRLRCNGVTSLWTRLILRDMKTANERPLHFEEAGQARGAANGDSGSGKIDRSFCRKGHWSEDLIKKNPETWVRFWCCTIDKWRFPEMEVPVNHPFE